MSAQVEKKKKNKRSIIENDLFQSENVTLQNTQKKRFLKSTSQKEQKSATLCIIHMNYLVTLTILSFHLTTNHSQFPCGTNPSRIQMAQKHLIMTHQKTTCSNVIVNKFPVTRSKVVLLKLNIQKKKDTTQVCSLVKNQYKRLVLSLWVWSVGVCLVRLFLWAGRCGHDLFLLVLRFLHWRKKEICITCRSTLTSASICFLHLCWQLQMKGMISYLKKVPFI